jgi:ankyrin repeat protein
VVSVKGSSTDFSPADADECLLCAARDGLLEGVQACLAANAEPSCRNDDRRTPLHLAAQKVSPESGPVVRALVERHADMDAEDKNGKCGKGGGERG